MPHPLSMSPRDNGSEDQPPRRAPIFGPGLKQPPIFNLTPVVQWLVLANSCVFVLVNIGPDRLARWLVNGLSFVPAFFIIDGPFSPAGWLGLVGHMFLHIQLMHFLVNMGGLLAFGTPVERILGPRRLLLLYAVSGMFGIALNGVFDGFLGGGWTGIYLGASGAVSGLFGAILMVLFGPRPGDRFQEGVYARRRSLMPLVQVVGIVVAFNVLTGVIGLPGVEGGIAWVAHLGGLAAGMALFPLLSRR